MVQEEHMYGMPLEVELYDKDENGFSNPVTVEIDTEEEFIAEVFATVKRLAEYKGLTVEDIVKEYEIQTKGYVNAHDIRFDYKDNVPSDEDSDIQGLLDAMNSLAYGEVEYIEALIGTKYDAIRYTGGKLDGIILTSATYIGSPMELEEMQPRTISMNTLKEELDVVQDTSEAVVGEEVSILSLKDLANRPKPESSQSLNTDEEMSETVLELNQIFDEADEANAQLQSENSLDSLDNDEGFYTFDEVEQLVSDSYNKGYLDGYKQAVNDKNK